MALVQPYILRRDKKHPLKRKSDHQTRVCDPGQTLNDLVAKGLFVLEIEEALLDQNRLAVHSLKICRRTAGRFDDGCYAPREDPGASGCLFTGKEPSAFQPRNRHGQLRPGIQITLAQKDVESRKSGGMWKRGSERAKKTVIRRDFGRGRIASLRPCLSGHPVFR